MNDPLDTAGVPPTDPGADVGAHADWVERRVKSPQFRRWLAALMACLGGHVLLLADHRLDVLYWDGSALGVLVMGVQFFAIAFAVGIAAWLAWPSVLRHVEA